MSELVEILGALSKKSHSSMIETRVSFLSIERLID